MKNKRFIILALCLLLCGCSKGNVIHSSKDVSIQETTSPSPTTEVSKILKEVPWQTVTTNGFEIQYYQFESLFLMEVDTKDLSEVSELEELNGVNKLKVQYLLTSEKYGDLFVFDVTDKEKALYGCEVKKNKISEIEVYTLDVTKDPNRLMGLTEELFSIIQDVIVFDKN